MIGGGESRNYVVEFCSGVGFRVIFFSVNSCVRFWLGGRFGCLEEGRLLGVSEDGEFFFRGVKRRVV